VLAKQRVCGGQPNAARRLERDCAGADGGSKPVIIGVVIVIVIVVVVRLGLAAGSVLIGFTEAGPGCRQPMRAPACS
jgi:hypothetical protein